MARSDLNSLQAALGHTFRDERLLVRALTHSSLAHEQALDAGQGEHVVSCSARDEDQDQSQSHGQSHGQDRYHDQDNEQLEFLGDAVLGLVVAEILFRSFPEFHEGEWTRLRASLVSRSHMARVAADLGIGKHLLLGRGEERSGGRKKTALLANSAEAIIGALYLDGGLPPVERFVSRNVTAPYLGELRAALDSGLSLGDHKSALQELLQARKAGPPDYVLKAESGPDHRKRFLVEVRIPLPGSGRAALARGIGTTKKKAEQEAARRAFEKLRKREESGSPAALAEGNDS